MITELLLDGTGGSRVCELRLCGGNFSPPTVGRRGCVAADKDSGVCLLDREDERNELLNLGSVGVPKKLRFGDGTLLYRSMDCLKHQ